MTEERLNPEEKIIPVQVGPENTTLLVKESSYPQIIGDLRKAGKLDSPSPTQTDTPSETTK